MTKDVNLALKSAEAAPSLGFMKRQITYHQLTQWKQGLFMNRDHPNVN